MKMQNIKELVEKVIYGTGDIYHDIQFVCNDGSVSFYSGLLVPHSSLLSSVFSAMPCCVKNDPILVHLDGFSKATVQAFVQCISTGESKYLTQTQLNEVVKVKEILRMTLRLDMVEEQHIKVKDEKIDHHLPLLLTREKVEGEHDRLTKMVMEKIEMFNGGATLVPCSECEDLLSQEIIFHHYKEHVESVCRRKVLNSKPGVLVSDYPMIPVAKKTRGRPRKSTEEKKVSKQTPHRNLKGKSNKGLASPIPRRDRSSSSEKEFKCANPTFKIKAGEKKVRKKREKKVVKMSPKLNSMLLQEKNKNEAISKFCPDIRKHNAGGVNAANVVPEIKLSFDLGTVGSGVKEINLRELSAKKRGRKRKVGCIQTDLLRGEESGTAPVKKVFPELGHLIKGSHNGPQNPKMTNDSKTIPPQYATHEGFKFEFNKLMNNKDDSTSNIILDPRHCPGNVRENFKRQLASMSPQIPFPEFLKNVCREANKTEGLVSGSNEEIENIKDNHKVLDDVVHDNIVDLMEKGHSETEEKSVETFMNIKDVLNESSDCDNLVMDLSDEENV